MTTLDSSQQAAVDFGAGRALLLAGPGCGKTHILAERVATARSHGIDYADMLCLTFTNRAARGMRDRIAARMGELPEGLFIGNIHRFCLRFLHANGLVSADTAILDEDDAADFIDRHVHISGAGWRAEVQALAVDRYMTAHAYPQRLHRRLWFEPRPDHLECVRKYERFKRDNNVMDFDDCLLWTYDALSRSDGTLLYGRYRWVQVDEVQDLSPLQMAIAGLLAPGADATVLYLGDEQQAIFDFLGAGRRVLERIKAECGGRVMRLSRNYRSTAELVELCNTFAVEELGIDPDFLPDLGTTAPPDDACLLLVEAERRDHTRAVAALAQRYVADHPDETTAILVRSNAELAEMHRVLDAQGIRHLAVGVRDAFRLVAFKTVCAHLAVAHNPLRGAEWARLLYATGTMRRPEDATSLVAEMRDAAMTPADLLSSDGLSDVERAGARMAAGEQLGMPHLEHLGRLLFPQRRGASLAELFGGDAAALQAYLAPTLAERLGNQRQLAATRDLEALRTRLQRRYGQLWSHTRRMIACDDIAPANTLRAELDHTYITLAGQGYIEPLPRWQAMLELLAATVTDTQAEPRLREQLAAHLHELSSFNEGDLYDRRLAERLSVMTVHKAKGLEMDNVIVANANTFWGSQLDRARIFYVAFSRARKRLAVFYSGHLTEALRCVEPLMTRVPARDFGG